MIVARSPTLLTNEPGLPVSKSRSVATITDLAHERTAFPRDDRAGIAPDGLRAVA